jgi:hypothetical protein
MYSQLHRGNNDKTVEKKEAIHVMLDATDRRKEQAKKLLQHAQQDRQRGEKAKGLAIDDLEDMNELIPAKKLRKTPIQLAEKKVAQNPQPKQLGPTAKGIAEPLGRFRLTTSGERNAQHAQSVKQLRCCRATLQSKTTKMRDKTPKTKQIKTKQIETLKKPKKVMVMVEPGQDSEYTSTRKPVRRRPVFQQSSNGGFEESEVIEQTQAARSSKAFSKKQNEATNATTKTKPSEKTAEECVPLAGITQAEKEDQDVYSQAKAEAGKRAAQSKFTTQSDNEEKELRDEMTAIERAKLAYKTRKILKLNQKKRKTPVVEDDIDEHSSAPPVPTGTRDSALKKRKASAIQDAEQSPKNKVISGLTTISQK